jgi:hypothetical protein
MSRFIAGVRLPAALHLRNRRVQFFQLVCAGSRADEGRVLRVHDDEILASEAGDEVARFGGYGEIP